MKKQSRPFVLIKTAMSLDGCIDDSSSERLILSNAEDIEAVDELKSSFDAILVGSETIRRDNPRLTLKFEKNKNLRLKRGQAENPMKVTLTRTGCLDPHSKFFTEGTSEKLIYCPNGIQKGLKELFIKNSLVNVVGLPGDAIAPQLLLEDLSDRGVKRLMIEGGGTINHLFLKAEMVDELRIAVAPFFVADSNAPRLIDDGALPFHSKNTLKLLKVTVLKDIVILHYSVKPA